MPVWGLTVSTNGEDLYEITDEILGVISDAEVDQGVCTVFIRHTSASLLIHENADPIATEDLRRWFRRLVPEGDPLYRHTDEGPDDMPAHIRSVLTHTSLSIPIVGGEIGLGKWQGVFVWEHRRDPHEREVLVAISHD